MNSSAPFGLDHQTVQKIRDVFTQFPEIDKVVVYGSRAKGNFKSGSDIDMTIFSKKEDLSFLFKVEEALDELYLPYKIDLSLFSLLDNENLKDHIARIGIAIYPE